MSVSKNEINPLQHIAQLEQEIASAELLRRQIREQYVVERRKQKASLRDIGKEIGLSHVGVHHILALHEAKAGRP
ncbi:hypothetical protein [Arthrobacter sp. MDT1-65]